MTKKSRTSQWVMINYANKQSMYVFPLLVVPCHHLFMPFVLFRPELILLLKPQSCYQISFHHFLLICIVVDDADHFFAFQRLIYIS